MRQPQLKALDKHLVRLVAAHNLGFASTKSREEKWLDDNYPGWRDDFDSSKGFNMIIMANSSLYIRELTNLKEA